MVNKLKNHLRNGGLNELIIITYRYFLSLCSPIFMKVFGFFPTKKTIVFSHFDGKAYGGNPGIICDELIRSHTPYKLIWIVERQFKNTLPEEVDWVPVKSMRQLWTLSRARVWIDDCRKSSRIRKSKKQYYIQTWHGGGPCLKKIEKDAIDSLPQTYIRDSINDSKMANLFISACDWRTNNYRQAFWYKGEILKCGTPTSDVYSQDNESIKKEVYSTFGINNEKHIVLYAPTFRSDHNVECYKFDYSNVLETLKSKFGFDWVMIVRLHPTIMDLSDFIEYSDKIVNGSLYPQFEDLLIASDILITDYSGCMFEAYRLNKRVFIFASDLVDYVEKERDLYFNIKELPAPVSTSNQELCASISAFDASQYNDDVEQLLKNIGYYPYGNATNAVVERINKVLKGE